MNIQQALTEGKTRLATICDNPAWETEFLLCALLKVSQVTLRLHPERELTDTEYAHWQDWLDQRSQGVPAQYLTGVQGFWTLELKVTPDVLIPRPETESLVSWILAHFPQDTALQMADLGTGSGAIALALASERPHWHIDATDFSAAALKVAEGNAAQCQIHNVSFYRGSWCTALPQQDYDLIVSNPPYIAEDDCHLEALRFEPQTALVAGNGGLRDYLALVPDAWRYLKPGGHLVLEHGFGQQADVIAVLQGAGFVNVAGHLDQNCQPRFVVGQRPS